MDYVRLVGEIVVWLREKLDQASAKGFVVGLSGGIDSAVVVSLCKQTLGAQLLTVWLPCYSLPEDEGFARMAATSIGVDLVTIDLSPVYDALLSALPPGTDMARANLKPRLRMSTLYYMAQSLGYLVVGTGNKPETMVGFFTKHGDGGVDLKPIGEFYKHEVRELVQMLGIPQAIIDRVPTPGLWPGQTDEGEMGITYAELDAILAAWDLGRQPNLPPDRIAKVKSMVARSAHKRALPPSFPVKR
jgi:NAD+ synthase